MKIKSVVILALSASLVLGGCSKEPKEADPTPGASSSSGTVPENEVDGPQPIIEGGVASETDSIERTYESFISLLFSTDPNVVKTALSTVYLTDASTDADREVFIQACIAVNPQAWALVDLGNFDSVAAKAAYVEALAYTSIGAVTGPGQYQADLDPTKIVFSSPEQASVPSSAITMIFNGVPQPVEEFGQDIHFTKKDGGWVIEGAQVDTYQEEF